MRRVFILAAVLCASCKGGGLPSGSSAPAPTPAPPPPAVARDAASERDVAADISPPNPGIGTVTTIRAPGFLVREERFNGQPFYLWPQSPDYVRAIVYDRTPPRDRLLRWASGFTVSSDGLEGSELETLADAVEESSAASGLAIPVQPGGEVTVVVDPSDVYFEQNPGVVAYTRLYARGNTLVDAEVVFASRRYVASGRTSGRNNTMLHEFGHVLGLTHSIDPADVMSTRPDRRSERTFGDPERLALKVIYRWRTAGNAFPDTAPVSTGASAAVEQIVILD